MAQTESCGRFDVQEIEDENILYELLVYSEWKQEPELLKATRPADSLINVKTQSTWSLRNAFHVWSKESPIGKDICSLINHQLPWQFAIGEKGKVVAVAQDTLLEIRSSRDEYSSVVGKAVIPKDPFPQWRKLAWSPDCSMLACAYSNGTVGFYDLLGSNIFTIYPPKYNPQQPEQIDSKHALACVLFLQPRIRSPKWSYELILVDYQGFLRSYLVSPTDGFQDNHTFCFSSHYRNGINAVSFLDAHRMLLVSGVCSLAGGDDLMENGCTFGVTAWRLLNDYPHYKLTLSEAEEEALLHNQRGLLGWIPFFQPRNRQNDIFKMSVSPEGKFLVCLHVTGSISVWALPSLRMYRFWSLTDQPHYNAKNPQLVDLPHKKNYHNNTLNDPLKFHPVDVNWWSENALIIARYSGSISVCSTRNLQNLLGDSPEFFDGQPQVSSMCDKGFLGLECELLVTSKKRLASSDETSASLSDMESSDEDDGSVLSKSSSLVKEAIYWVTDSERFQPKRKRSRILHRTYRLLGLKSTTPEELYSRKIDNEEYGEALALAHAYNLDCDLVYQRQWRNSKVSISTIHDYLSKVTKQSWVLEECKGRVPETLAATKELLQFGLKKTNLEVLIALGREKRHRCSISMADEKWKRLYDFENEHELNNEEEEKKKEELLSEVEVGCLTNEQCELIMCRQQLLEYLDRLNTYETILGGPQVAETLYDSVFYEKFRSAPVIKSTVDFARNGDWQAVENMFAYHWDAISCHWLAILSNFPETMNPSMYSTLLPECGDGEVFQLNQVHLRNKDWCEEEMFKHIVTISDNGEADFLYEEELSLLPFKTPDLTIELLCNWYVARSYQIEMRSKMVDHALTLVRRGRERNVRGLDKLLSELVTLDTLVYEVHVEDISLAKLEKMTDLEKVKLLMSSSTDETFIDHLKCFVHPFLKRSEKQQPSSKRRLLRDYLVFLSTESLKLPLKVFKHFRVEQLDSLVSSVDDIISLALDCLYTYPEASELDVAFEILECVPERGFGTQSNITMELHDLVDKLESHLRAAEILERNGIPKPLFFIRDVEKDSEKVSQLMQKLARNMVKRVPPPSESDWNDLLNDMLDLQCKVFSCVELDLCFELYATTLLLSNNKTNILCVGKIVECTHNEMAGKKIPYSRGVQLVLEASREYFDSAGSLCDPSMELAKACLHLIGDDNAEIQEELNLISSLQLLHDFGVKMLPLQVRLCPDKMQLVKQAVRGKALAYRNYQRLLQLSEYLNVCGDDSSEREGKVLTIVARTALEAKDYHFSAQICQQIMDKNFAVGWEVMQDLGQCTEYDNLELRRKFLAFALLHCSPDVIEVLVKTRCLLETEILHQKVNRQIDVISGNQLPGDEEFSDALCSPGSPQKEFLPISSLLQAATESTGAVKQTTYNVIKNIGDRRFWTHTFNWIRPLQETASPEGGPEWKQHNLDFAKQGFHSFYTSLHGDCHHSLLGANYNRLSTPHEDNPQLELLQILFRIAIVEETVTEGSERKVNSAVTSQLSENILPDDCLLGLAHLLTLEDPFQSGTCFNNISHSSISLQLATYYFALRVYSELHLCEEKEEHSVFLQSPSQLVEFISGVEVGDNDTARKYKQLLEEYRVLLVDYLQGKSLQALDCGINLQRFTRDAEYRQDTILGLAMTEDVNRFELSLALGRRYGVPTGQIAAEHIAVLLLNQDVPLADLTSRVTDESLIDLLKSCPAVVCEKLVNNVYPNLSGTDHHHLIIYYTVLLKVAENFMQDSLPSKEHLKLLKKVRATSQGIDYKRLVADSDLLDVVYPVLKKDNVVSVAKLLKSLPAQVKCQVHPGRLYSLWAQKYFFEEFVSSGETTMPKGFWIDQYEKCAAYFSKMSPPDVLDFTKGVCFQELSLDNMSVECRAEILRKILGTCEKMTVEESNKTTTELWSMAGDKIKSWLNHLMICGSRKDYMKLDSNTELQHLYRLLDMSCGESQQVEELLKQAILSPLEFESFRHFLSLLPKKLSQLDQVLEKFLSEAVENLRLQAEPPGESPKCENAVKLLQAVLRRVQQCVEEDVNLLADAKLWDKLEPLCANNTIDPSVRLQALQLLHSMNMDLKDNGLLHYYHTQAIIASAWPTVTVQEEQLETEGSRLELFQSLLSSASSWKQIATLKELLQKWPQFKNPEICKPERNPWVLVITKAVQLEDQQRKDVAEMVEKIFTAGILSEECMHVIVAEVERSGSLYLLLIASLVSEHASLHHKVVDILHKEQQIAESDIDNKIMNLILKRNLLSSLVGSPIYSQLLEHLLASSEGNHQPIDDCVRQLKEEGHLAEAGSLSLLNKRIPTPLCTFSSAVGIL